MRDAIKQELLSREVEELSVGHYIVRWTSVLSQRFDTTAFKKVMQTIFPITERMVQKQLRIVCDYLGYEDISTHSFRKWYATEIYKANGYDIVLVQRLLQHSSAATTQRYIGIEPQRIEDAIQKHSQLL